MNTDREQQLLDDFEWKLREVEQACKKRLEEKERTAKQRIKEVEDKLIAAEKDLSRVSFQVLLKPRSGKCILLVLCRGYLKSQ